MRLKTQRVHLAKRRPRMLFPQLLAVVFLALLFPVRPWAADPTFTSFKQLTALEGLQNDQFGSSVAVDEDVLVVGSVGDDGQGSGCVLERNAGGVNNWGQLKRLTAIDGAQFDAFGWSVSVSGDVIVVGASQDSVGMNGNQGSVYVFERNAGGADNWGQTQKLNATDGAAYDLFGSSVAVSGTVAVVGTPYDTVGSNAYQGSSHVYWGPSLALLAPMFGDGEFHVTLSGFAGKECALQVSSNLVDWASVTNVTQSTEIMLLSLPAMGGSSFYRALLLPVP